MNAGSGGGGFTVVELLFTCSLAATIAAVAIPLTSEALDQMRTGMAARYLAGQIRAARMDAVKRAECVGFRFDTAAVGPPPRFGKYQDGNGNGLRTSEIQAGIDRQLAAPEALHDNFPGTALELIPGTPDVDGATAASTDGVRIGASRILTLSPDGTATSGTLYVRGRRAQYAVRVLGTTGRTRVLQFRNGSRTWITK